MRFRGVLRVFCGCLVVVLWVFCGGFVGVLWGFYGLFVGVLEGVLGAFVRALCGIFKDYGPRSWDRVGSAGFGRVRHRVAIIIADSNSGNFQRLALGVVCLGELVANRRNLLAKPGILLSRGRVFWRPEPVFVFLVCSNSLLSRAELACYALVIGATGTKCP